MRQVLIVVDMQNDFVSAKGALSSEGARNIVPFITDKVKSALANGQEVVFTLDSHETDDKEFEKFPPHCLVGSWGQELIAELRSLLSEEIAHLVHFVKKSRYSGFYGTDLADYLGLTPGSSRQRVDRVQMVGVCTNICCYFTAEELANRDVPTVIHKKGMASFDSAAHEFALSQMETVLGAKVI